MTSPEGKNAAGPLNGVAVLEFSGLGPIPFAAGMLADLGAHVIHVCRPASPPDPSDPQLRGRTVVKLDLKAEPDRQACINLASHCDILIEGFRPGVMERLGLGPDAVCAINPALVYGRMTGWGQDGPLAPRAGHDLNYLAQTGVLHALGPPDRPTIPLNLIGDFGGGSLFLLTGILAALHQARMTGKGATLDVAMVDGIAMLSSSIIYKQTTGQWSLNRESNYLDGGAPFYNVYRCADGKFVAVAPIEPQFYDSLRTCCGLTAPILDDPWNRSLWPEQRAEMARVFENRPRDEWVDLCAGADTCLSPVLDFEEAAAHPHGVARHSYDRFGEGIFPAPAPRISGSGGSALHRPSNEFSASAALEELERLKK